MVAEHCSGGHCPSPFLQAPAAAPGLPSLVLDCGWGRKEERLDGYQAPEGQGQLRWTIASL